MGLSRRLVHEAVQYIERVGELLRGVVYYQWRRPGESLETNVLLKSRACSVALVVRSVWAEKLAYVMLTGTYVISTRWIPHVPSCFQLP